MTVFTKASIDAEIDSNLASGANITASTLRGVLHDTNTEISSVGFVVPGAGGQDNIFLGESGNATLTGSGNIGVGPTAGADITTGSNNTIVGYNTGRGVTTGSSNTVVGDSLAGLPAAMTNTVILAAGGVPVATLDSNSANKNVFVGASAGNMTTTGSGNVALGPLALSAVGAGTNNVAIGQNALAAAVALANGIAIGTNSCQLVTGGFNTMVGASSLAAETTGSSNTGLGYQVLFHQNGASQNCAMGYHTGWDVTAGGNNTLIGYNCGRGLTTGSGNTCLGYNITGLAAGLNNAIVISSGNGVHYDYNNTTANVHTFDAPVRVSKGYTVATLPTGVAGATAYVTDGAAALAWGATVTGGGSTPYLVWYNGSAWTVAGK